MFDRVHQWKPAFHQMLVQKTVNYEHASKKLDWKSAKDVLILYHTN